MGEYAFDLRTNDEQEIWSRLYQHLLPNLESHASHLHKTGIRRLKLDSGTIPAFSSFAESVRTETGWVISKANGELGSLEFFRELAAKQFPVVKKMRPTHQLYGGIDPDFWHEAFGHIPPLVDTRVSDLYIWFGKAGVHAVGTDSAALDNISKLYWSIAEYGFLSEEGQPTLFGAALIGSPLAVERYLAGKIKSKSFSVRRALSSEYDPHRYQPNYLKMESIEITLKKLKEWYPYVD